MTLRTFVEDCSEERLRDVYGRTDRAPGVSANTPVRRRGILIGRVDSVEATDDGPRIVKSKRFAMFPMSAEEAVERMELVGHGFFFFTNAETSRAAVVYRRDDGNVGLIDEAD